MNKRLYVIVRKDLICSSPAVQAAHCVAEFCLNSSDAKLWNNNVLIFLGVEDLKTLQNWKFKLTTKNIMHYEFKEPDLNGETTAICAIVEDNKLFKKLKLL